MSRILLAEDDDSLRGFLTRALERAGFEVLACPDGDTAAEALNEPWDLLLTDIVMPGMDGIEATRRLKLEQPETLVIGLSVHNDWQIEEAMRAAGAVSFLPKDAAIEQLHETIQVAIRAAARTA